LGTPEGDAGKLPAIPRWLPPHRHPPADHALEPRPEEQVGEDRLRPTGLVEPGAQLGRDIEVERGEVVVQLFDRGCPDGIPFTVVPQSQPPVAITYGTDAPIEGGSTADPNPSSGDRHVLVVQQGSCVLYKLYNAVRTGSGFRVSSSARWDLKVNATRPAGWTSADAAGLPILAGLLKYDEVAGDRLTHALRFTVPRARHAYTAPASHCGQYADPSLPPYGKRVRLKAGFDLSPYTGDARVILTALKKYGLIFADQGSAWYVTGTSDPRWEDALDQLRADQVHGRDFEVVRLGPITSC